MENFPAKCGKERENSVSVTFVENPDGTKTATITYSHQAEFSGEIVYIDLLAKTNDLLDFLF